MHMDTHNAYGYTMRIWTHNVHMDTQYAYGHTMCIWTHTMRIWTHTMCIWTHTMCIWTHNVHMDTQCAYGHTQWAYGHTMCIWTHTMCIWTHNAPCMNCSFTFFPPNQFLTKNQARRLGCQPGLGDRQIKTHAFFRTLDWEKLEQRQIASPFKPQVVS